MVIVMRVTELRLKNFRGYANLHCKFASKLYVLAGPNGAGKSTILDALSIMLSHAVARMRREGGQGNAIRQDDVMLHCSEATISLTFSDQNRETRYKVAGVRDGRERMEKSDFEELNAWARSYRQARTEQTPVRYPIIAYYGVNRAVLDIPRRVRSTESGEQLGGYDDALSGHGNFRQFFAWFRDQEDYENERGKHDDPMLSAVRSAIEKMLPGYTDIHIRRRPAPQAMCAKKDGKEFELSQLSDGEKCYLALIGDIACRMARLSDGLNLSQSDILNTPGVVLIDELDLHLHPKWQRDAIRRLPEVFPEVQFIITTHSPQMLSELPSECVGLLAPEFTSPKNPNCTIGLTSSEVLRLNMDYSPERDAMTSGIEKRVHAALNEGNIREAESILHELERNVPNYNHLPLYTTLLSEIKFMELK